MTTKEGDVTYMTIAAVTMHVQKKTKRAMKMSGETTNTIGNIDSPDSFNVNELRYDGSQKAHAESTDIQLWRPP